MEDPKTSYYDYFAAVYRLERSRLIRFHIKACEVLLEILGRIEEGETPLEALRRVEDSENEEEYKRNRVFLAKYLKKVVANMTKTSEGEPDESEKIKSDEN